MHEVLVNRLGGLSLPRKSVVRLTDRPDMTLDVYRGRETTMQCNNQVQRGALFSENISEIGVRSANHYYYYFSLVFFVSTILTEGCGCFAKNTQDMCCRPRQNVIHVFLCLFSFHFLFFLELLFSARRFELKTFLCQPFIAVPITKRYFFLISLSAKKQTTKFTSANSQKIFCPSYIKLKIKKPEGKLCRSR